MSQNISNKNKYIPQIKNNLKKTICHSHHFKLFLISKNIFPQPKQHKTFSPFPQFSRFNQHKIFPTFSPNLLISKKIKNFRVRRPQFSQNTPPASTRRLSFNGEKEIPKCFFGKKIPKSFFGERKFPNVFLGKENSQNSPNVFFGEKNFCPRIPKCFFWEKIKFIWEEEKEIKNLKNQVDHN